jgi:hypothetical protein
MDHARALFALALPTLRMVLCASLLASCAASGASGTPVTDPVSAPAHAARSGETPVIFPNAQRGYDEAMVAFNARDWHASQDGMREVLRTYPYSRYARSAALRIADADVEQGKLGDAVRGYRQFLRDHACLVANGCTDEEFTQQVEYAKKRIDELVAKQPTLAE